MMNGTSCFCWRGFASYSLISLSATIWVSLSVQAQTLGPLVQVTVGDPFGACTTDNVHRQQIAFGSSLYPNTAIEPWVAVDRTDPSRLLIGTQQIGTQQNRWSDGGLEATTLSKPVFSKDVSSALTGPSGITVRVIEGQDHKEVVFH